MNTVIRADSWGSYFEMKFSLQVASDSSCLLWEGEVGSRKGKKEQPARNKKLDYDLVQ